MKKQRKTRAMKHRTGTYQLDLFGYNPNALNGLQPLADQAFQTAFQRYAVGPTANRAVQIEIPKSDETAGTWGIPSRMGYRPRRNKVIRGLDASVAYRSSVRFLLTRRTAFRYA